MSGVRVNVVADLLEERWPSMDLVADMLMSHLGRNGVPVSPVLMRPVFSMRLRVGARDSVDRTPLTIERIAHRFWDYPRWLRRQPAADVYHIVDHSYAHLASELPSGRVVTTCHDADAFRTLLFPDRRESSLPRFLVRRVLDGLQRATLVVCDSHATRGDLVDHALIPADRTTVVPLGTHPACSAAPDDEADLAAARLTGPAGEADLLHVGSTIERKRIDLLLEILSQVARMRPGVKLWRVGGAFTPTQTARVRDLGLVDRIQVLPFVTRPVLAALYRRAALVLLPSDREGFGLPVAEALACGTPIVASDLPVLREVGGAAAEYCPAGEVQEWAARVVALLEERESDSTAWEKRRRAGVEHARLFSWDRYAGEMEQVYSRLTAGEFEGRS